MESKYVVGSKEVSRLSNITQNFFVFERKFFWKCSFIVPFSSFALMVLLVVLQIYYVYKDESSDENDPEL